MSRTLFAPDSLESVVRAGDRRQFKLTENKLRPTIEAASLSMLAGTVPLTGYHVATIKTRRCVTYKSYEVHLLLRSISKHLRRRFHVASPSRDNIVRGLIEALLDATPSHVVRRDIRSFYETLPTAGLQRKIGSDTATPPLVRDYLERFFAAHCPTPMHVGIPRGTPISPLLADIAMQEFDDAVKGFPGVFRYYRFADDIIAFTTEPVEVLSSAMAAMLPEPMQFSRKKSDDILLGRKSKTASPPPPASFEYLGYKFLADQTKDKRDSRSVQVRISEAKIKRLKSRIALAIASHVKNIDWQLLCDRIQFITSNIRILRAKAVAIKDSPYVHSGLYYNYRACGTYSVSSGKFRMATYDCAELKKLDGFYFSAIHRLTKNVVGVDQHVARLKRLSFFRSYDLRIQTSFSAERLAQVKACWRNM